MGTCPPPRMKIWQRIYANCREFVKIRVNSLLFTRESVKMEQLNSRNIGLDLVRVTETAALAAGRWIGSGNADMAHLVPAKAMMEALATLQMDGRIVIGEEKSTAAHVPLSSGLPVGTGFGPQVDVVVDSIDGTDLLIRGRPGAISVVGISPRDSLWSPVPAIYMEKIIVDQEAANALVPECMDAPAAWTIALIARVKNKAVHDTSVFILDKLRHKDLIEEVRATGARILLRKEGDVEGALMAAMPNTGLDILMGIGGASQGVIAACAVKALGGAMLARLAPQSQRELSAVDAAGLDRKKIMDCNEMVRSNEVFFAATGITDSEMLAGMRFHGSFAETYSLLLRSETGTRRFIHAEHHARM